jgi:hypothetical protein
MCFLLRSALLFFCNLLSAFFHEHCRPRSPRIAQGRLVLQLLSTTIPFPFSSWKAIGSSEHLSILRGTAARREVKYIKLPESWDSSI